VDYSVHDVIVAHPPKEAIPWFQEVVRAEVEAIRHAGNPCLRLIAVESADSVDRLLDVEFGVFERFLAIRITEIPQHGFVVHLEIESAITRAPLDEHSVTDRSDEWCGDLGEQ
jgi:hypothetical protein